jgi:uncharacterized repeat protein (TIGR04138 family)
MNSWFCVSFWACSSPVGQSKHTAPRTRRRKRLNRQNLNMQEVSFEEALDFIRRADPRYQRDAYLFVREALDYTQKTMGKDGRGRIRHVTGQELLAGIREFALNQFGPMAMMVLEEWGIRSCEDFGEIVFNMVETGGAADFSDGDITDLNSFSARLRQHADPISQFIWGKLPEATREQLLAHPTSHALANVLLKDLNQIIRAECLYEEKRFAAVALSHQAKSLLASQLHGAQLARLNRLLLEEVYPSELAKSPGLLAKTNQDSRADFEGGYDFHEAFRKPFLPLAKRPAASPEPAPEPSSRN